MRKGTAMTMRSWYPLLYIPRTVPSPLYLALRLFIWTEACWSAPMEDDQLSLTAELCFQVHRHLLSTSLHFKPTPEKHNSIPLLCLDSVSALSTPG